MQSIFDAITEWLKGLLVEGIMGNLGGLFTGVNEQVGEIAAQVGMTPAAWNSPKRSSCLLPGWCLPS